MMSSNRRIKGTHIDRLSALPDSIIIYILSLLEVNQSAITSVLSKRWQFLWRESPRLIFRLKNSWPETVRNFVNRVHRTLVICGRNGLETFEVELPYNEIYSTDVDVWVDFAVRNKVKQVSLVLNTSYHTVNYYYTLPQMIFQNSYLKRLTLRRCIVAPRRTIEWGSLTELRIGWVELTPHAIEKILSGCPVLHFLCLAQCWGFDCLEVDSKSLRRLGVHYRENGANHNEPFLRISAPNVRSLLVSLNAKARKLVLGNVSSLGKVNIGFIGSGWDTDTEDVMENAKELLEKIRHVKVVKMSGGFSKVISSMVMNGYQLPQSARTQLSVKAPAEMRTIHGLVGLLESSPNLEELVTEGLYFKEDPISCPDPKGDMDCDLLHLKTITIKGFIYPNFDVEPLLKFARVLLKKATTLEKMVVNIEGTITSLGLDLIEPYKIAQTLLSYPRSSVKAVILLK